MTSGQDESKICLLIFDDDPTREADYRQMEDAGDVIVDFRNLKDKDTSVELKQRLQEMAPDIIFVDHVLDKTTADSASFMRTGKCITPILREKWPRVPIVAVTAAKEDCIERDGYTFYEEVFDVRDISQLDDFVRPIVTGYRFLEGVSNPRAFIEFLKPPPDEIHGILQSIPDELRALETDSFAHEIYRWFRRTFYGNPGFLYDKGWTAMTMGIDETHLHRYLSVLDSARYEGIWADPNQPRWWKKTLYEIALDVRESSREPLASAACRALNVKEEDYSSCYKCGMKWPDVLAYTDESLFAALVPAHLECSTVHPKKYLSHSFEEPRIIAD